MKVRTIIMVAAILGVIAFLVFGPLGPRFGRDARTAEVQHSAPMKDVASAAPPASTMVPMATSGSSGARDTSDPDSQASFEEADRSLVQKRMPLRILWRTISFEDGSAALNSSETQKLTAITTLYRSGDVREIVIVGNQGAASQLTKKRTESVRQWLLRGGIPEHAITTFEWKTVATNAVEVATLHNSERRDRSDAVPASPPR